MITNQKTLFQTSLLLFGSFALGFNLANALHELGHAIALWVTGGVVERITLHPFSWSYTYYGSTPNYPIATTAAGIVFGTFSALALVALVWRFRNQPWTFIFIMTGIAATAINGLYAIVDPILLSGGDGTTLVRQGVPKFLIIGVGVLLLVNSILLAVATLPLFIKPNDTLLSRVIILEGGVLPYLLSLVVYHFIYQPQELGLWSLYAGCGTLFLLSVAMLSRWFQAWLPAHASNNPSWAYTGFVATSGIVVIVLELMIFQ